MLRAVREELCFTCHSSSGLGSRSRFDIATLFQKRYRHPVAETSAYHSASEELPEKSVSALRHVACGDCHNTHLADSGRPLRKLKGYRKNARLSGLSQDIDEYELCYKCHSDSANLKFGSKNKREEFDPNNPSYHPVERPGKNQKVPSLIQPYTPGSTIKCTDCHGNDDQYGPKGPHGSNYEYMLKYSYVKAESSESPKTHELCYSCHDRRSILNNDSFRKHKEHVALHRISCSICHNPHGSATNQHLITFDSNYVGYVPAPVYMASSNGKPMCLLTCHIGGREVLHDNTFYLNISKSGIKWP
jgi:predicted CXXCH cytochrome family protein